MFERATPKTQQKKKRKGGEGGAVTSGTYMRVRGWRRVEEGGEVGKRIIQFQRTEYLIRNSKM